MSKQLTSVNLSHYNCCLETIVCTEINSRYIFNHKSEKRYKMLPMASFLQKIFMKIRRKKPQGLIPNPIFAIQHLVSHIYEHDVGNTIIYLNGLMIHV